MDKSLTMTSGPGAPIIAHANWFQFGPAEIVTNACVESRMFLWCHSGRGRLRLNGGWREFVPNEWVLLPWRHEIIYEADARQPFIVGGIHVLPHHDPAHPMEFRVAHRAGDPLARKPWRRDVAWPGLDGVATGTFEGAGPLRLLAEYIVESFRAPAPDERRMRMLATLFIAELGRGVATRTAGGRAAPARLRRMHEYIQAHLGQKITVTQLARIGNCSKASVHRLFRDFNDASPGRWITRRRVGQARQLLRSTTLRVKEVGQQVGLPDQFHFSRLFKQHTGLSPTEYQQRMRFI